MVMVIHEIMIVRFVACKDCSIADHKCGPIIRIKCKNIIVDKYCECSKVKVRVL